MLSQFNSGISPKINSGISPKIIEHKLNILYEAQPIRKKKRHFSLDKDKVIRIEITKLLEA